MMQTLRSDIIINAASPARRKGERRHPAAPSKIKTTGEEAAAIEKYYHNKYESAGLYGFDGATEWLKYSTELMNEIMNEDTPV